MRAARFHGNLDIRIDTIPCPIPKDNEVLIAIEWCGICGSDLHEYEHGPMAIPTENRPHPITQESLPITMGHEFCGIVTQIPQGSKLKVGQKVMVDPRLYCRDCTRCEVGKTHACYSWGFRGLSGGGGGLSEMVAVDERLCYVLPEEVDLGVAALIEPLAVATHAVKNAGIPGGEWAEKSVLVLGGGPIGLAVIAVLRMKGVGKVFVSEPTANRQRHNKEVADVVFDPTKEKVGERCMELTGGEGVNVVFDCAGIMPAMQDGVDALCHGGIYVNIASWVTPFILPQFPFMLKEITIKASLAYKDDDFRETVEAFSKGAFPGIEKFVTGRILLEDVVEKGFKELFSNKDDHIKILVSPKKEYFNRTSAPV